MALSGFAKLPLACPEEAISLLRCSIEINRNYPLAHFWLAAALMRIGRPDEARTATQASLALSPSFTIARVYRNTRSPWIDNYYRAQRERLMMACARPGCRRVSTLKLPARRAAPLPLSDRASPLSEPAVDRREKIASLVMLTLITPQPRHAHGGADFQDLACC
jgi:tetratricopeptide (TPR) repeat protein